MAGGRLQTNTTSVEPLPDSILVYARSVSQRIYVQTIRYLPAVYVAGTVLKFLDSLTGVSIGQLTIVPAVDSKTDEYVLEFGAAGIMLSTGANLQLSVVSGGVTGIIQTIAYQLPLFIVVPYKAPHTAGSTKQTD